jgi:hypothetical protein
MNSSEDEETAGGGAVMTTSSGGGSVAGGGSWPAPAGSVPCGLRDQEKGAEDNARGDEPLGMSIASS